LNLAFRSQEWHRLAGNSLAELFLTRQSKATMSNSSPR
jgi:hypothetical protein